MFFAATFHLLLSLLRRDYYLLNTYIIEVDSDMELDAGEGRRGLVWFIGAGLFAFALSVFLARTDLSLTYSDTREQKGREMQELRLAQTSLRSGSIDNRNLAPQALNGTEEPHHVDSDMHADVSHAEEHPDLEDHGEEVLDDDVEDGQH